jgi:hypothetical protein
LINFSQLTKRKREKTQINKIRDDGGETIEQEVPGEGERGKPCEDMAALL